MVRWHCALLPLMLYRGMYRYNRTAESYSTILNHTIHMQSRPRQGLYRCSAIPFSFQHYLVCMSKLGSSGPSS